MPISDPSSARVLVFNTVVPWIAEHVGLPTTSVDVGRSFSAAPPDGYSIDAGEFDGMCDEIAVDLTKASQRDLRWPANFKSDHQDDEIAAFINTVAVLLIAAPLTPTGVAAHTWAMG